MIKTPAFFLFLLLAACSSSGVHKLSVVRQSGDGELPMTLEVKEAFNDGRQLHVAAAIGAHADWDVSQVVLVLRGLRNGTLAAEKVEQISEHVPQPEPGEERALRAGNEITLSLAIPSADVEEYQLELLWGDDAAPWLMKSKEALLSDVSIAETNLSCREDSCASGYHVSVTLKNGGLGIVHGVRLRLGFVMRDPGDKLDLSSVALDNEREINISPLEIQPGTSRAIRLNFNAPLTRPEGVDYVPVVRVVGVN